MLPNSLHVVGRIAIDERKFDRRTMNAAACDQVKQQIRLAQILQHLELRRHKGRPRGASTLNCHQRQSPRSNTVKKLGS
jgi:hypothetical protein